MVPSIRPGYWSSSTPRTRSWPKNSEPMANEAFFHWVRLFRRCSSGWSSQLRSGRRFPASMSTSPCASSAASSASFWPFSRSFGHSLQMLSRLDRCPLAARGSMPFQVSSRGVPNIFIQPNLNLTYYRHIFVNPLIKSNIWLNDNKKKVKITSIQVNVAIH